MLNYASKYPTQTTAPDANYPLGGAQNVTSPGDGTGTPWDEELINDIIGFFQALITETGVIVSGNAETAVASDLWDALKLIYSYLNANKLIENDTSASPGSAEIGNGYKAGQFYGTSAVGGQYYGRAASGGQYYGSAATGAIEVGATTGSAATKKLISGAKVATFEDIIDSATPWGSWQTISYNTGTTVPGSSFYRQSMVCRKSSDGKNVQISGAFNHASGSNIIGTLPSGYRPANLVGFCGAKVSGDLQACQMTVNTNGEIKVYNDDNVDIAFEATIPLD